MLLVGRTGRTSCVAARLSSSQLEQGVQRRTSFVKTRLPPKIKRRQSPNEHKNVGGVFHSGLRLPVNLTKHHDRLVDVCNDSAYHPPFLIHDYIMDTADYILEPFNAGKGVVMNREHVLNSFDFNGINDIEALTKKYMHEPEAGSVTFWKSSSNVFSTGTNFIEILQNLDTKEGRKKIFKFYRKLYQATHNLHNGPSLLCPFVDGLCMGSAASWAVNCPVTATGSDGDLCWPETSFGFHPDAGAVHILSTLPCGIGQWMALTGSRLTGNSIVKAGLGNYTFSEDLLHAMQRALDDAPTCGVDTGFEMLERMSTAHQEPFELLPFLKVMEKCFTLDTVPQIMEALAAEAPTCDWAKRQLAKLKTKSPLSLVVTLEALQRADRDTMSIDRVLRQDFRLTTRFLDSHDFREGVQKLIVDRGKKGMPKWEHASPADVPASLVDAFFAPTGDEDTEFVVHGHDDKKNFDEENAQFEANYRATMYGFPKTKLRHRLGPFETEREQAIYPELSNLGKPMPLEDVLEDKGYAPLHENWYLDEAYTRSFQKDHYEGPAIWKKNSAKNLNTVLSMMSKTNLKEQYEQEQPVSEDGLWRANNDWMHAYNLLRETFNVVQHPYPLKDSIIQGRTVSAEEAAKSEAAKSQELGDSMEDHRPFRQKPIPMRFPPGEKLPTTLKELDRMSFSDDDYSTAEEEEEKGPLHLPVSKDVIVQDPEAARWDSEI